MRTEGIFHEGAQLNCNLFENKKNTISSFSICLNRDINYFKNLKSKKIDRGNFKKIDFENCLFLGY